MAIFGVIPILVVAEPLTFLHRRGVFLGGMSKASYDRVINIVVGPLLAAGVVASVMLARRYVDRRPLADLGVRVDRAWWRGLGLGAGVGAAVMAMVFAIEWMLGWVTVSGTLIVNASGVSLTLALSFSAVKVLCVGTYEEFLSRGYHLRTIAEATTPTSGVLLSSAIFAALHLGNDNASVLSTIGLFVNALLFAAAVLLTGRLSTAIGAHITWNFFQGAVFGFPVSGDKEGASLIGITQRGPDVFTGGAFGPEAGIIGVFASVLGIVILAAWTRRVPTNAARWRVVVRAIRRASRALPIASADS